MMRNLHSLSQLPNKYKRKRFQLEIQYHLRRLKTRNLYHIKKKWEKDYKKLLNENDLTVREQEMVLLQLRMFELFISSLKILSIVIKFTRAFHTKTNSGALC